MAIILVADDLATNREFLSALLSCSGYGVVEATDGAEALRLTKEKRPVLVIVDILMPIMDGYEFTRQLRLDPDIAHTPVIFYTATYREQEAREMAKSCGVAAVLSKPCEPEEILYVVNETLRVDCSTLVTQAEPSPLLHDRFFQEGLAREAVSLRLTTLVEASLELSSEQDPQKLLDSFTRTARDIIGAAIVTAGIMSVNSDAPIYHSALGIKAELVLATPPREFFNQLITGRCPIRRKNVSGDPTSIAFPPDRPPLFSVLAVPMSSSSETYGWLALSNKIGADEFSEEDERLAFALASQVAVIYEKYCPLPRTPATTHRA